ncbi:hypothetical protein ATE80_28100 [Streptomyces kanasensis]|uniref:Uncharacterized protein n=1 Tax=Streptomyces kanasensis TaxID=936756 RepID=A0A100Y0W3_9ACTN|nr:hypothetical protein ATE80_28100 [Streptomyces kanasensis]
MDEGAVTRLGVCGAWAFSLERSSAEGMETQTLERVSLGTECVVALDSGTPPLWFAHAVDRRSPRSSSRSRAGAPWSGPRRARLWGRVAAGLVAAGVPNLTAAESVETVLLTLAGRHCEVDLPRVSLDRDPHPALLLV